MGKTKLKQTRFALFSDVHTPFEDIDAYALMLEVVSDWHPDILINNGDLLDGYSVNSHGKNPAISVTLADELHAANNRLDQLDHLFSNADKVYIEGNHEFRLERYLRKQAPELHGIIHVEKQLYIDRRPNWTWVPYGPDQIYQIAGSALYCRHSPFSYTVNHARNTAIRGMVSILYGCTHQIQEAQVSSVTREQHRCISVGWLGDVDHPVFQYRKNPSQWALGFVTGTILADRTFYVRMHHIIKTGDKYRCIAGDDVYERTVDKGRFILPSQKAGR